MADEAIPLDVWSNAVEEAFGAAPAFVVRYAPSAATRDHPYFSATLPDGRVVEAPAQLVAGDRAELIRQLKVGELNA